jgi:putative SOS response-associated peptidase YedK
MCGRYTLRASAEDIAREFELAQIPPWTPRYNIAPTQDVLAVRMHKGEREATLLRWGLIPSWTEDVKKAPLLINAKCETAAAKPAFRAAFERRRCLVLADGFYEWQTVGKRKQPYYYRLKGERPFAFAGLWEFWKQGEQIIRSCAILTTDANELTAAVHDRMPVLLDRDARRLWLDPQIDDPGKLEGICRPYPASEMVAARVNPVVNKAANDGPECIAGVTDDGVDRDLFAGT